MLELLEDEALLVRRDADPRVGHGESQHRCGVRACLTTDGQYDFALRCEFDRVANEVDDDLSQPRVVSLQQKRDVAVDLEGQFESLARGPHGQRLHRVAEGLAHVENGGIKFKLACFDLREVEHIVDEREQRVARLLDDREVFPLVVRQLGIEDQFGHADDRVHRRANLVTHVGEEVALGFARRVRSLFCFAQFLLGPLLSRHVPEHPLNADHMPVGRANRTFERLDEEPLSVGADDLFDGFDCGSRVEDALIVTAVLFGEIAREQIEVGFVTERLQRRANGLTKPLVAEDETEFGVLPKDAQWQAFDQRLVVSIRFPQCFPRGDIFRHIPEQNLHADDSPLLISDGRLNPVYDPPCAVQPRQLFNVM